MSSLMETRPPQKGHRWKYVGLGLLILIIILLCGSFLASLFFGIVPPISGTVVDAVTGTPVPAMNVCLEARVRDFGKYRTVRNEIKRSDPSGKFSFAGSIHQPDLFQHWVGYSIRVTDPKLEVPPPCGAELVPAMLGDFREGQRWKTGEDGGTVYFPVAFVHETINPNRLPVSSVRREMSFAFSIRVEMIPLLGNANECPFVQDSSLAGYCVLLNNSAAAGLLRQRISGTPQNR